MDVAVPVLADLAAQIDLFGNLGCGAAGIFRRIHPRAGDAGPNGPRSLLPPPVEQGGETLFLRRNPPVKLRREVINPAVFQPLPRVAGQLLVAVDARLDARRHAGPPDPKRADPHAHPRLLLFDGAVEIAHKSIDIGATLGRAFAIRERETARRIRVKIIIEVNSVDVVAPHHVEDDAQRAAAGVSAGGIAPRHRAEALGRVRRRAADVVRGDLLGIVRQRAKRIEPRMHLDPAGMGFADTKCQRIVARRATHRARQAGAPRLHRRRIDRIALRAHLENHRVHFQRRQFVEHRPQLRLLARRAKARRTRPVEIVNAGDPRAAKLARQGRRALIHRHVRLGRCRSDQPEQREKCDQTDHGNSMPTFPPPTSPDAMQPPSVSGTSSFATQIFFSGLGISHLSVNKPLSALGIGMNAISPISFAFITALPACCMTIFVFGKTIFDG